MTSAGLIGKKGKRGGEASLFNETGQVSDETFAICKVLGIETRELFPKTLEHFLKKGVSQQDAQKNWQSHEEKRLSHLDLIKKEMMMNNSRQYNRKATSVMNRLAMPHQERILKSAFKTQGKNNNSQGGLFNQQSGHHRRQAGLSQTPYMSSAKGQDLTGHMSPEFDRHMDVERKYERAQRRWDMVLDKKHMNTDQKQKHMKELLAKKFKREKEMAKNYKVKQEEDTYNREQRVEHFAQNDERRRTQDLKIEREKQRNLKESMKRQQIVSQRRLDILQDRASQQRNTHMQSSRGLAEKSIDMGGHRDSSKEFAPMKQRAFSSTGRTQAQFKELHEIEEIEGIKVGLQRYEVRMQRAAEQRACEQNEKSQKAHKLTNRVDEKLAFKKEKTENDFKEIFEKNVLKRHQMEEKKKKKQEERNLDFDDAQEKKQEKLMAVQTRQHQNKFSLDNRNKSLEKRWQQMKKRSNNVTNGQAAFYESMAAKQEIQMRNKWLQQMNLERKQRQQQDYKMLLAEKLQTKEQRASMMQNRRNQLIEYGQRANQALQENFYRTTQTTRSAIQPQPFDNHKKEFDNMKEVKVQEKQED